MRTTPEILTARCVVFFMIKKDASSGFFNTRRGFFFFYVRKKKTIRPVQYEHTFIRLPRCSRTRATKRRRRIQVYKAVLYIAGWRFPIDFSPFYFSNSLVLVLRPYRRNGTFDELGFTRQEPRIYTTGIEGKTSSARPAWSLARYTQELLESQ